MHGYDTIPISIDVGAVAKICQADRLHGARVDQGVNRQIGYVSRLQTKAPPLCCSRTKRDEHSEACAKTEIKARKSTESKRTRFWAGVGPFEEGCTFEKGFLYPNRFRGSPTFSPSPTKLRMMHLLTPT